MDEYNFEDNNNDRNVSENEIDRLNGDLYNYKGYFAQDDENEEEEETKIFEFGAHFPYCFLYRKLEALQQEINEAKYSKSSSLNQETQSKAYDEKEEYIQQNNNNTINLTIPQKNLSCLNHSVVIQENNKPSDNELILSTDVTKLKINRRFEAHRVQKEKHNHDAKLLGKSHSPQKRSITKYEITY